MTLSTLIGVALLVAICVSLAGILARLFVFERDADEIRPSTGPRAGGVPSDTEHSPGERGTGRPQPAA
jgi:FlaG/FlaF family flagellin (archaellin)